MLIDSIFMILDATDFEWYTDNDIPIFSNGRLSLFLYLYTLVPLVTVVNTSLVIPDIPLGNVTFTCRLTRLHTNYTYFIQATERSENQNVKYTSFSNHISFRKTGETVTLPCVTEKDIGSSTTGESG